MGVRALTLRRLDEYRLLFWADSIVILGVTRK